MQQRVFDNPKIEVVWNSTVLRAEGDQKLEQVVLKNLQSGEESSIDAAGLFFAIGHQPNTAFLNSQLKLDAAGYIITQPGSSITSVPGVFAAGDVQDPKYRQAITSAGSGCMAALDAEHFLQEQGE
jgi:thioredoxin reductase (NADPH)